MIAHEPKKEIVYETKADLIGALASLEWTFNRITTRTAQPRDIEQILAILHALVDQLSNEILVKPE